VLTAGDLPQHDFDAVVVGSGFGGSVTAYRLAERGECVLVLERGKAYPPGSFPRTPAEMAAAFWDPSEGLHGMFNLWSFAGIDALTASGLGGGSLIYANVHLRKDPSWFRQDHPYKKGITEAWPIGYDDLEPHYEAVEKFLEIQPIPSGIGDPLVPKHGAMAEAAERMGMGDRWHPAPLAVRFRDGDGNPVPPGTPLPPPAYPSLFGAYGATRRTCILCGECDIGCNAGAKNTLDHTYLAAASHHGAIVSQRSEVVALRRRASDGFAFEADFVVHRPDREGVPTDTNALPKITVRAKRLIISAGSIGSTYLLLLNRKELGIASPALGTRYCGNGDLLGFILNSRTDRGTRPLEGSVGPVITSYIRWPDKVDTGDPGDFGMYIEDAGFPAFAEWLVESTQLRSTGVRAIRFALRRAIGRVTGHRETALSGEIAKLLGAGTFSNSSLPLLGMGRDIPDGRLELRGRRKGRPLLDSTWTIKTSKHYFDHVRDRMHQIARALRGDFHVNPQYLLKRVITVHSLGGCPMADNPDDGVVDRYCQVHGVPGLYVADAAVLPGPVGPNPSLTIAATASWMVDHMAAP
jgi:cholesterol oxidase